MNSETLDTNILVCLILKEVDNISNETKRNHRQLNTIDNQTSGLSTPDMK